MRFSSLDGESKHNTAKALGIVCFNPFSGHLQKYPNEQLRKNVCINGCNIIAWINYFQKIETAAA